MFRSLIQPIAVLSRKQATYTKSEQHSNPEENCRRHALDIKD